MVGSNDKSPTHLVLPSAVPSAPVAVPTPGGLLKPSCYISISGEMCFLHPMCRVSGINDDEDRCLLSVGPPFPCFLSHKAHGDGIESRGVVFRA